MRLKLYIIITTIALVCAMVTPTQVFAGSFGIDIDGKAVY